MPQRTGPVILVILLATGALAFYFLVLNKPQPIQFKPLDAGLVLKADTTLGLHLNVKGADGGRTFDRAFDDRLHGDFVFEDTILSRGPEPGEVHRKRYFERAVVSGDNADKVSIQGKTFLIVDKAGKTTVRGSDTFFLFSTQVNHVADLGDLLDLCVPPKPVPVNTIWQPDMKKFAALVLQGERVDFEADKAIGTVKLLKVYEKGGHKYGTLELHLEVSLRPGPFLPDPDEPPGKAKRDSLDDFSIAHGQWASTWTLDACIDGGAFDLAGSRNDSMTASMKKRYGGELRAIINLDRWQKFNVREK